MIVFRLIKELLICFVHLCVIFAGCYLEVRDPCKLTINVSLLTTERRPGRHTSPANSILLVGVQGLLWLVRNKLLLPWRLVKILLYSGERKFFKFRIIGEFEGLTL